MKKDYTIAVAGTGYVGLSIATLLSQHHKVMAVDIVKEKVDLINNRKSPIQDNYIEKYLAEKELNLTATLDTPLHGTGYVPVTKALALDGFTQIEIVKEQAVMDGNFPTVVSPNPEDRRALELGIEQAKKTDADIVLGTDPDSDRVGIAVKGSDGSYQLVTGNQVGALLMSFILKNTDLSKYSHPAIVKTIVTSELGADIARKQGINVFSTLTGFKFIGEKITQFEQAKLKENAEQDYDFLFGYMIIVSRIFRNEFSGASYFYVDDSVIFTNDVIETEFKEQLKEINKQIEAKEREILQKHSEENLKIYPCKTKEFYESYLYGVHILFLACYLHDISMVKIPACDSFLLDTDKADELAKTLLDSYNEEFNKANLTKNVQGNDIDILSVKKYMLDSYRKIDNYFEEAVRSKHANDSAAEIRKRSELNYLDTSMRELVAEVSEAHGADERDIYGIKSVASKQLISIKFDKILLRLADLLDMSSYRVSKPILYHNVEQMSEESAFHWISHLLTKGYSLRTEYEITDNAHVLAPKNIIEKLVLEIPVNISQMSALTCGRTCKKVGIDRNRLSQQGIVLVCGQECKDNGNQERNCNFLCKWFCVKNENLIKELAALKEYLNRNKNNYFKSAIEIRIKCNDRTSLDARQFEILNEYIGKM